MKAGTGPHMRLVDLLNDPGEASDSAVTVDAAYSSRAAELGEGDSLIVLSQTDSLASLKNKLSFRKRSQSSDKVDINRLESLVNGQATNNTPSQSKTFHVADLQSYSSSSSNNHMMGSSSASKLPSARSMAKAKYGTKEGSTPSLFSQDDADPLSPIYHKINDNNRMQQLAAPSNLALVSKSPKASKRLQNVLAESSKDGEIIAGDKDGSSVRKSSSGTSGKQLAKHQSNSYDGLLSKDNSMNRTTKALSLIHPTAATATATAAGTRPSRVTATTAAAAAAAAASAIESATAVNDKAKAVANDKILSDRLEEAKAQQRRTHGSGAVVHQFALWSNAKKAAPGDAGNNLPSPNSILKNKLTSIISDSCNFILEDETDVNKGIKVRGSKAVVGKAEGSEEQATAMPVPAPASVAEGDAQLAMTPQRGPGKSSSSSLASALRTKVGHAKSLHQSSDSLSPNLSRNNSNSTNTNLGSTHSLLSPKTSKGSLRGGDSSPDSSLVTKYSEDFCDMTVDGEGGELQAVLEQGTSSHSNPHSSMDADDLSVEEEAEVRLLSTIKRSTVHSSRLQLGAGPRFAASEFSDKSDAEIIEMAEGAANLANTSPSSGSGVMSFMPITGADVSSTDYLASLGMGVQSQSLLEASSPLSELSANGSDLERDDMGAKDFDSQRTYKKSSGSSSGRHHRIYSPQEGGGSDDIDARSKANVTGSSSGADTFRDPNQLLNIIDEKCTFPWKVGKTIGEGTFGKVYRGMNESTGELLAVKQLMISDGSNSDVRELCKEITIMRDLQHDNIVRYLGTSRSERCLFILIEFVSGGSIANMLSQFGPFSEPLLRRFSYQILCGVGYLHSKGIIHRDVKGANVLVTESGVAKLADFGCSKQLVGMCTNSLEESMRAIRGSVPWMAPEVIKQSGHGRSADIWSVGATVIEMATGKPPWPEFTNNLAALFHVATSKEPPPVPAHLSPACSAFLKRCIVIEAKDRSSSLELVTGDAFFEIERGNTGKERSHALPVTPLRGAAIRSHEGEPLAQGEDQLSPSLRLAYEVSLAESQSI